MDTDTLESFFITDKELKALTGYRIGVLKESIVPCVSQEENNIGRPIRPSLLENKKYGGQPFFSSSIIAIFGVWISISLVIGGIEVPKFSLIAGIVIGIFTLWLSIFVYRKISARCKNLKPNLLGILLDQIDKFNSSVKKLVVYKKLQEAGNPIDIEMLKKATEVHFNIKADLIRALRTEKIFRDNPQYKPSDFKVDTQSLEKTSSLAKEYQDLIKDTTKIGEEIQSQIEQFNNWN